MFALARVHETLAAMTIPEPLDFKVPCVPPLLSAELLDAMLPGLREFAEGMGHRLASMPSFPAVRLAESPLIRRHRDIADTMVEALARHHERTFGMQPTPTPIPRD